MPDREDNHEPHPAAETGSTPVETATAPDTRKRRARREKFPQDDVPFTAAARLRPDRMERAMELARVSARIADDNRAKDILVLDLSLATPLVDFFVIATASSRRQSHAIAEEIDQEMKRRKELKLGMEGSEEGRWVLIDYGDFVVHIFSPEARGYYSLEEIWGDAVKVDWQDPSVVRRPAPEAEEPFVHEADDPEPDLDPGEAPDLD